MKLLKLRGLLHETPDGQPPQDTFAEKNPAMAAILQASLFGKNLLSEEASQPPIQPEGPRIFAKHTRGKNCEALNPFPLHANSRILAQSRTGLESMIRYRCRLALATERVELLDNEETVRLRSAVLPRPPRSASRHSAAAGLLARRHHARAHAGAGLRDALADADSGADEEADPLLRRIRAGSEVAPGGAAQAEATEAQTGNGPRDRSRVRAREADAEAG